MVKYLPSYATRTITVLTAEVGTELSINAPANVIQGQSFEIFGVLQRIDTNEALNGEEIELWVDGIFVSSMLTDWVGTPAGPQPGAYQFFHSIVEPVGDHLLDVKFLGSEKPGLILGSSNARLRVGMAILQPIVAIVSAALGLAFIMVGCSK